MFSWATQELVADRLVTNKKIIRMAQIMYYSENKYRPLARSWAKDADEYLLFKTNKIDVSI
jgi:hypothetical protein